VRSAAIALAEGLPGAPSGGEASLPVRVVVGLLAGYKRFVSPLLPPACRFQPTCSEFAREAVRRHGLRRGGALSLRRLMRCHPFHPGGHDPVP
jgi:putative membrane protein insertion efficiency factor